MQGKILKTAVMIVMLGLLSMLFGCKTEKAPEYPFDTEKAYCISRGGIIAGGSYEIKTEPEGKVKIYSYIIPAPEGEDGMKDSGANIYFVGIEPGEVTVTVNEYYPSAEPEKYSFTLVIAEDLSVSIQRTK